MQIRRITQFSVKDANFYLSQIKDKDALKQQLQDNLALSRLTGRAVNQGALNIVLKKLQ